MAEFMIIVMPQDPVAVPAERAIGAAVALMEDFFPDRGDEVKFDVSPRPRLVTSRDAFESLGMTGVNS